ncbi:hypothetical protein CBS147332_7960 [Penicillium roqueforti]|nr:hypothetical protein CBS147332_7960 [Penicillium roqueforti]KAI2712776.1 hypothetical protein CBS147318_7379 [Penicillium roqueforti]KAI3105325.1 hypothetical protein CBS147331_7016 [Penicillium roqueforti]KAI3124693.1 hypothetical protein CBS147330_6653 [Penicillium roqueforti]KAI3199941.1 hypothetical protein CBS147311_5624 [Penicillium roqueforti]
MLDAKWNRRGRNYSDRGRIHACFAEGLTNRLLRPLNRVEPGASMGHCPSEKEMCWIFYIVGSVSIWRGL